jgi:hypothetical protein
VVVRAAEAAVLVLLDKTPPQLVLRLLVMVAKVCFQILPVPQFNEGAVVAVAHTLMVGLPLAGQVVVVLAQSDYPHLVLPEQR